MDMNLMLVNTYTSIWTIGLYERIGSRKDWNRIQLVSIRLKQREHQCTTKLLLFYQHTRYSTYNKQKNPKL